MAQGPSYDEFGIPSSAVEAEPRLGYRGELTVDALVHLRARDYHPVTGAFTTTDPVDGFAGSTTIASPYPYVSSNPLNHIDPLGLFAIGDGTFDEGAIGGPVGAGAAGGACAGAVSRGLSASEQGLDPWAAALDLKAVLLDAAIGGATGFAASKVAGLRASRGGRVAPSAAGLGDDALQYATRAEKLEHILVPKHNLDPFVRQFGSREAVVEQMLRGVSGRTLVSGVFEIPISIGG